jgi:hypothetical protein
MQLAEGFVFLLDLPHFLIVEADLDEVFSVCSVVYWILHDDSIPYLALKSHLEKMRPTKVINLFRAGFYVFDKNFCWVE